jgi:hypothetical protein
MTEHPSNPRVGYLRSCMDRRFLAATRRKFEEVTGLKEGEYFHEAMAGGALNPNADFASHHPPDPDGAAYVYGLRPSAEPPPAHPVDLVFMGWQAHLDECGGLKGKENTWISASVMGLRDGRGVQSMREKYPDAHVTHIFLIASLVDGQPVVEVYT